MANIVVQFRILISFEVKSVRILFECLVSSGAGWLTVPNRVRVAVRLRPRNAEELQADVDFADCVELQPEVSLKFPLLFLPCHESNLFLWNYCDTTTHLGVNRVSFGLFQLKRLKLRKNNWDCETYQFDEVLTETSSQKRVYEVVAKPVVEVAIFHE